MRIQQKQAILCPACGKGKLINTLDADCAKTLKVYPPEEADKAEWFLKCPLCKRQIGVAVQK